MARRNDHTREQIRDMALLAAENIIEKQGLSELSTRKIAKKINYTVGTIYLVFVNLDDLILQINTRTLDQLYGQLVNPPARHNDSTPGLLEITPGLQRIYKLAHTYFQFAQQHFYRWNALFVYSVNENIPVTYQARIDRIFILLERLLTENFKKMSAQNIQAAARTLWCGVHGICVLTLPHKPKLQFAESSSTLVDNLVGNYLKGFE